MRVPAVACAVALISETVGALPAKLYSRDTKAAVPTHPAYRLQHDEANDWTSASGLNSASAAHVQHSDSGSSEPVLQIRT